MKTSHKEHLAKGLTCFVYIVLAISFSAKAQPSGGPYGPIRQLYELPKVAGTVYYVAPDGKSDGQGLSPEKPTSIEAAIERVKTGDAIILRGGVYRTGNLIFNQGITIQPYADEQPILKGTFVAREWKNNKNGLWTTKWGHFFPSKPDSWWNRLIFGKKTPMHRFNNDMVFVDGKFLQSVGEESDVDENTFFIDYESGLVYIGSDPSNKLVEITAFNIALHRITGECHGKPSDKKGPVIKGITFTQYAYCALEIDGKEPEGISDESKHGKDVVGTIIENCSITFCSRVAAYLRGDKLVIKNCKVSDTSTEGIYIIASNDVLLKQNIFSRNNIENITGYYPAAVKIFNQCYRLTCEDNLVIDLPNSNGIWYDVGNVDGRFINNWVEDVGHLNTKFTKSGIWPSENGFFFEISKGMVCAGNVFVNCEHGILILNSSDVKIYNNTLINSTACIARDGRNPVNDGTFGWHSGTGPDVDKRINHVFVNNLLFGNADQIRPFLFVWQPGTFYERNYKPQLESIESNVFIRSAVNDSTPTVYWTQAINMESRMSFQKLEGLQKLYPEFSGSNHIYSDISVFKSLELGNFQTLKGFPGNNDAGIIPTNISKLLNLPEKDNRFTGAYPPAD